MAFCSNCGAKLSENTKFCANCGVGVGLNEQPQSERKMFYDGEIHKCPSCGEVLNSFTGNCPACGYELRGAQTANSVKKLTEQLAAIEQKRKSQDWKTALKQKFNGQALNVIDQEKINLIKNFPIPNTKEDIREFLILAEANKDIDSYGSKKEKQAQLAISEAWEAKYEQAYKKAKIILKDDEDFKAKQQEEIEKKRRNKMLAWIIPIGCVLFIGFWIVFGFWMGDIAEQKRIEANPDGIRLNMCDEDLVGKQYYDVVTLFESKGFINIEVRELPDLITGWLKEEGEVESVSINGDIDFQSSDRYDADAKIVITYHVFK